MTLFDSSSRAALNHLIPRKAAAMSDTASALEVEIRAVRDKYVHDQVSGQLAAREGDMTRTQIDDCEIDAKLRWAERHPAMARFLIRRNLPGYTLELQR